MMIDTNILKEYIDKYFPIIHDLVMQCPVFLMGGSIRDLILNKKPKDLDFVCLCDKDILDKFIRQSNLSYRMNRMGGYNIQKLDISIDIWCTNDLYSSIEYNLDGLFFDIAHNQILSFGYYDALEKGLRKINPDNNIDDLDRQKERKEKLLTYLEEMKKGPSK